MRWLAVLILAAPAMARADAVAYGDARGVAIKAPRGLACTANGRAVLADSGNGRLLVYALRDSALQPVSDIRFPELGVPLRVQLDRRGNILALDGQSRRIVKVDEDGRFGGFAAFRGVPQGGGFFPISFKLDANDRIFVLDGASARVLVFAADGAFASQLAWPQGSSIVDLAVDAQGRLLLLDGRGGVVYRDGKVLARIRDFATFAGFITVSPRGLLVLTDTHGGGVVTLSAEGKFLGRRLAPGHSDGFVDYPQQVCLDEAADLFVADMGNNRLQVFTAR
jgi:hypothetical protein